MNHVDKPIFKLNGTNLTPEILQLLGKKRFYLDLDSDSWERVEKSESIVQNIVRNHEKVYGITTGFGFFSDVLISHQEILELQKNIIRSHSTGVGSPIHFERVREILVLRINVIAKGHSGLSKSTLKKFIKAYNDDLLPLIYDQGTVGASGDLAPLSHLCLGLQGEGKLYDFDSGEYVDADIIMKKKNYEKIELRPKEGLSLINGTQFLTSFLNEAYIRAKKLALITEIVFALTIEVLNGSIQAFHPNLFTFKSDSEESKVAERVRHYLLESGKPSELRNSFSDADFSWVSEPHSFTCFPQVHGQIWETLKMVGEILKNELNAVTDNPLIFTKEDCELPEDHVILSGGNFHGEYIAKAADYLGLAIHDLAMLSERRIERLVNPHLNQKLPAFLAESGGLNSGFMIVQYTAASLVSENKHLSNPASVDTIPTSAEQEDHVSMGGWASRKALKMVENAEQVVAIELMSCCQALDLRKKKVSSFLENFHEEVRKIVPYLKEDDIMSNHLRALAEFIRAN